MNCVDGKLYFTARCFYHASSRETSEILLQNSDEGSYLIRSGSEAGHYTVSVRASDSVRHFKIECHGESYSFGQAYFWSPVDVWEHLKEQPVLEVGEGNLYLNYFTKLFRIKHHKHL